MLVPDWLVVRTARADIVQPRCVEAVPDLIVEVLSPSTSHVDRGRKRALFGEIGVPESWLVDPIHGSIEILVADAGNLVRAALYRLGDTAHGPTFAFAFPVDGLFERCGAQGSCVGRVCLLCRSTDQSLMTLTLRPSAAWTIGTT